MPLQFLSIYGYHLSDGEKYIRPVSVSEELRGKQFLLGSGREKLPDLVLRFSELVGLTDESTVAMLLGHGLVENGVLEIDGVSVAKVIRTLQKTVGHKITVIVSSCHSGALLKNKEIVDDENIVVLTRGGRKYSNMLIHNLDFLDKTTTLVDQGLGGKKLNKEQLLAVLVATDPETFWYYKEGRAIKLPRALKLTIGAIDGLLKSKSIPEDTRKALIAKLEKTNVGKDSLSMKRIQESLGWVDDFRKSDDEKKGNKQADGQSLTQIFYNQLAADAVVSAVEKYLRDRSRKITDLGDLLNSLPAVDMRILYDMGHYRDHKDIRVIDVKKPDVPTRITYEKLDVLIRKFYIKIEEKIKAGKVKSLQKKIEGLKEELAKRSLTQSPDLEHAYEGGKTALILAAKSSINAVAMCKVLIACGAETGRAYIYAAENDIHKY